MYYYKKLNTTLNSVYYVNKYGYEAIKIMLKLEGIIVFDQAK